jgi:hypothetical protein
VSDPTAIKALLGDYAEYPSTPAQENQFMLENEREERKKQAEDFELLKSMAHKASSGVYGKPCQDLAREFMASNAESRSNLETLRKLLRKVPGRVSG